MLTLQKFSGMLTRSLILKEMKNYKKIYLAMMISFLGISSCTKEDGIYTEGGSDGIIELADLAARTSSITYSSVTKSFEAFAEVDCPIVVNYTGTNGATEDVTVTLDLDPTIVNTMSTAAVPLSLLDASLYTIPSYTVVIPKGQKQAILHIKLKTASFDFSKTSALGIVIKSSSSGTVSGNYGKGLYILGAKNKWDGVYTVGGTMVDANGLYTGSYPRSVQLRTVSATSCSYFDVSYSAVYYIGKNISTGGATLFFYPRYVFDGTTNQFTGIQNNNTGAAYTVAVDAANTSYDAASKTIKVKYLYNNRYTISETLTYTGSR